MELIFNETALNTHFNKLICSFKHISIAVAWATDQCSMFDALCRNESKIEKMIVGLNFTRTTPRFIKSFMSNKKVRFLELDSHTFHPKFYFFYNSPSDWSLIIGSSNFTKGGFGLNMEACVLINSEDKQNDFYKQCTDYINNVWEQSSRLRYADFSKYKAKFEKQKKEHLYDKYKFPLTKYGAIIDTLSWKEYVKRVMKDKDSVEVRCQILKKAHELFNKYSSFKDFPDNERKCVAGIQRELPGMEDVDWGFFGTCSSNGKFTKAIIDNHTKLVKAIDVIPLEGEVTAEQYKKYCSIWKKEFKEPVALASRLLAMKRPDLFVCINSRNRKLLCNEFAISQSPLSMDSYWNEIVSRIQTSAWYKDSSPKSIYEKELRSYMAAMLDSIYYQKDN